MKSPIEPNDPKHPDMSPEAIDQRLRELGQLYKLGMALRNPTWIWRGNITEAAESSREKAVSNVGNTASLFK
jgi:hypothetical protein